jgi:hypothetical protein
MIIETNTALNLTNKYLKINSMTIKKTESDLDFIGGLGSLTAEEEKALSAYFKPKKTNSKSLGNHKKSRETKKALL